MSAYDQARQHGYSDEEILQHVSKKDPSQAEKIKKAIDTGYKPTEVIEFLSKSTEKKPLIKQGPIQRLGNQQIARGVETAIGAPRALGEALQGLVPEEGLKKLASKIGLGEGAETLINATKKYSPLNLLPKKEDVREFGKKIFGNALEPKNEWEAKANEVTEDFVDIAMAPLLFGGASGAKFIRPALTSIGANAVKEGIGQLGGSESQKETGKLGALTLSAFINPKAAQNLYETLYSQAKKARPKDAKVLTPILGQRLNTFENELAKGGRSDTWKGKIFTKVKEIKDKITNNEIEVDELEAFKRSINDSITELYAEGKTDKKHIKKAQRFVGRLGKIIDRSLVEYGRTNPQWEAYYRPANEAYGALYSSKKAMNFLKKNMSKLGLSHLGATTLTTYLAGLPGLATAAGTAVAGYPVIKTGEKAVQMFKSPTLRKHFLKLFQGALSENLLATSESAKKLEKAIQKEKD